MLRANTYEIKEGNPYDTSTPATAVYSCIEYAVIRRKRDLTMYRAAHKCHSLDPATCCPYLAALTASRSLFKYTCVYVTLPKAQRVRTSFGRACIDPFDDVSQTRPTTRKAKVS